jgi:hypothetical protein
MFHCSKYRSVKLHLLFSLRQSMFAALDPSDLFFGIPE